MTLRRFQRWGRKRRASSYISRQSEKPNPPPPPHVRAVALRLVEAQAQAAFLRRSGFRAAAQRRPPSSLVVSAPAGRIYRGPAGAGIGSGIGRCSALRGRSFPTRTGELLLE